MEKINRFKLRKVKKQWVTVAVCSVILSAAFLVFGQVEADETAVSDASVPALSSQEILTEAAETPNAKAEETQGQDANPDNKLNQDPQTENEADQQNAELPADVQVAEKKDDAAQKSEEDVPKTGAEKSEAEANKEAEKAEDGQPIVDPPKNQFVTNEQGYTFYYDEKGEKPWGLFEVDGQKYYQDPYRGIYKNRLAEDGPDSDVYYLGQDGHPITNQWWEDDIYPYTKYYFGPDGKALKGWQEFDGHKLYFDSSGKLIRERNYRINGKEYAFDEQTGYLITKQFLQYPSGKWYYVNDQGQLVTGYQNIDGKNYYFYDNGIQLKGLGRDSKGNLLYTDPDSGEIQTDQLQANRFYSNQNGQWRYLDANKEPVKGLQVIDGKTYYFDPSSGIQEKGSLIELDGKTYYFAPDSGEMVKGRFVPIQKRNNYGHYTAWYYFGEDGAALTGKQTINGQELEFYGSGEQIKNQLISDDDGFRFYDEYTGELVKNEFRMIGLGTNYRYFPYFSAWYYFDENGLAVTGWREVDGKLLYFAEGPNPDLEYDYYHQRGGQIKGEMWKIDGKVYYFDEWTGEKVTNRVVYYRGSDYVIDADGVATKSDKDWDEEMPANLVNQFYLSPKGYYYYLGADGKPVTGWQTINGRRIYFDQRGRQVKNKLQLIDGRYYYFDDREGEPQSNLLVDYQKGNGEKIKVFLKEDGSLASGWLTVDDKTYYFDGGDSPYPALVTNQLKEINGQLYCFNDAGVLIKNKTFSIGKTRYQADENGVVTSVTP